MSDETRTAAPRPGADAVPSTASPERVEGVTPPVEYAAEAAPRSSATAAPPGYELLDEIGRGGMGVVYRARDVVLDRDVAVKLLQERYPADSASARRFLDEAHITGQLQHPGIPAVHQVGAVPDGRPFLAMKLIKGRTLDELLKERAEPSAERGRFVAVFEQVCQAVGYAHAHKIIHRDLKPANVMVGAFGEVQVMDWGLAKVLTSRPEQPSRPDADTAPGTEIRSTRGLDLETQAGSLLGTPAFMPPEQAIGAVDQIDARSDVFGLGALLCMILTGQPPYVGADTESTRQLAARAKLDDAFARLAVCGAEPELAALCRRCLSAEKADRPGDAGQVAAAVAELRAAAEERARRAELDRARAEVQAAEQRKRRKVQLALAVAVGLLLCAGGAFARWQEKRTAAERERLDRNADAVATLLGQCEEALRADDATQAGLALEQAEKRVAEGGAERLADRFARCRADLDLLRELDASDQFRWTPVDGKYPDTKAIAARWRTIFAGYAIVPDETPSDEAAHRVSESLIRDRLLSLLDLWLVKEPSPWLRAVLRAMDAHPYRDVVRDAVTAKNSKQLAELAGKPEALDQPTGFAAALGQHQGAIPTEQRRGILHAAVRGRPQNQSLLMDLGGSYPINQREGADERLRWYQAAVAVNPRNIAAHNSLGAALHVKNDFDGAIAEYKEAIRLDPKYALAHNNLGVALKVKGDLDGAIAEYKEAIRLDPKNTTAHNNSGAALHAKNDFDGAIAEYKEAIRLDPKYALAHNNLGVALKVKGDLDGAIAEYKEAIRLDPSYAYAHNALGTALREKKDVKGAIAAYKVAIRLDPKKARFVLDLGQILVANGDRAGAIAQYRRAIEIEPSNVIAHVWLGMDLAAAGDLRGAIAAYERAIQLDPKNIHAHYYLADVLRDTKDLDGAIVEYKEVLRLDPKHADARNRIGVVLQEKKDFDGAIAAYKNALRLDPNNPFWYMKLGECYSAKRDPAGAVETAREAARLYPAAFASHHGLGDALQFLGHDSTAAVAAYRKAISLNPRYAWSHNNLGTALRNMGDQDGAVAEFKKAIQLDPKFAAPRNNLAELLRSKKDLDGSIAVSRESVRIDPKNADAYASLGHSLFDKKDLNGAIVAYRKSLRLNQNNAYRHFKLGLALKGTGDLNGAVAALTRARQISPTSGFIRNDLAAALKDQGDLAGAITEYKEAVRLDPNNSHVHDQLARLLATGPDGLRDGKRAVALATRSCELSQWKFAGHIDTLAAAYAESGDFNKAVEYQKKALAFPSRAKGESKDAQQRLELYTRKQPYRDPALVNVRSRREVAPPPRAAAR